MGSHVVIRCECMRQSSSHTHVQVRCGDAKFPEASHKLPQPLKPSQGGCRADLGISTFSAPDRIPAFTPDPAMLAECQTRKLHDCERTPDALPDCPGQRLPLCEIWEAADFGPGSQNTFSGARSVLRQPWMSETRRHASSATLIPLNARLVLLEGVATDGMSWFATWRPARPDE